MEVLSYSVTRGDRMSSEQWLAASELFSAEYGFYSRSAPQHAGARIRLGPRYYERSYAASDYWVAFCHDGARHVGQAIYREVVTSRGRVALVVQLVVASDYRRRGIASTLLHAVWGFSDYQAWGIVTSNAFTVGALEAATFRRASAAHVHRHLDWLRLELLSKVSFLDDAPVVSDDHNARVATGFFTDRSSPSSGVAEVTARLGELNEGEEWLAFVFREQPLEDFAGYRNLIDASSRFVARAYAQMPQARESWARATRQEVDAILKWVPDLPLDGVIYDFGAGTGRHLSELRRRGYCNLTGIDFALQPEADESVVKADCRTWKGPSPADLILCLYDVIGSFPDDADNEAIVRNIAANLRKGGCAVITVSNYDYLDRTLVRKVDFRDTDAMIRAVFELPPSRTMQTSGEFFDPNFLLVDEQRHLVCHKEQFVSDGAALPGEYLIRDRRFVMEEIADWVSRNGLIVRDRQYVRSGFSGDESSASGKEILLVCAR